LRVLLMGGELMLSHSQKREGSSGVVGDESPIASPLPETSSGQPD